jgi:antitoxin HicB
MRSRSTAIDYSGSSFDEFMHEEGILEEAEAIAIKRVIAWQQQREMQRKRISKKVMANRLRTSRSQLDRLLDPKYSNVRSALCPVMPWCWVNGSGKFRMIVSTHRATPARGGGPGVAPTALWSFLLPLPSAYALG